MDVSLLKPLIELMVAPYKERIAFIEAELAESKKKQQLPYRSADCTELTGALAKAQAAFLPVVCNKENRYFMQPFADIEAVVSSARAALTANHLAVTQDLISQDDGSLVLITTLLHESNEYIESRLRLIPPKSDLQTINSYINFWKRTTYASLLGIVTPYDDDDGECASASERQEKAKGTKLNTTYNPKENTYQTISKDQLDELEYELAEYPDIAQQIIDGLNLQALADMPKSKFLTSLKRIREIKHLRTNG